MSEHERGAAVSEYLGILVLVAAICGSIVALAIDDRIAGGIGDAVCRIVQRDDCGVAAGPGLPPIGPPPEERPPWESPDPLERATWGDYVALGDSYSSGEGAFDYGAAGSDEGCHGSAHAYSQVIHDRYDFDGDMVFGACTGARLEHLTGDYGDHGQGAQADLLDEDTSLVTMSLGGNDVDWAALVSHCIQAELARGDDDDCEADKDGEVSDRIEGLRDDFEAAYEELRERAPNARIVIVGYPRFFPEPPEGNFSYQTGPVSHTLIDARTQAWINTKARQLNDLMAEVATDSGVEFVDAYDAFDGHELTSGDPWMWGVDLDGGSAWDAISGGDVGALIDSRSFHPNRDGQAALAELVDAQMAAP